MREPTSLHSEAWQSILRHPWITCMLIVTLIVAIFPHDTDEVTGVHFHDEEIIEEWIEVHEAGYISVPLHSTIQSHLDSRPFVVQGTNANASGVALYLDVDAQTFSYPLYNMCFTHPSETAFDHAVVTLTGSFTGTGYTSPLSSDGCTAIGESVVPPLRIDLLHHCTTMNTTTCNRTTSWTIFDEIHAPIDLDLELYTSETMTSDAPLSVTFIDVMGAPIVGLLIDAASGPAETDASGTATLLGSDLSSNTSVFTDLSLLWMEVDGVTYAITSDSGRASFPEFSKITLSITSDDRLGNPWSGVALALQPDVRYGSPLTDIGHLNENGTATWSGILAAGSYEVVGLTPNTTFSQPYTGVYAKADGEPAWVTRFSVGNSMVLSAFSRIGLLPITGLLSLGVFLCTGRWFIHRLEAPHWVHWSTAIATSGSAALVLLAHADMMSDLHSLSLWFAGTALLIHGADRFSEHRSIEETPHLLAGILLLALAVSMRFITLSLIPWSIGAVWLLSSRFEWNKEHLVERASLAAVIIPLFLLSLTPVLSYNHTHHGSIFAYNALDRIDQPSSPSHLTVVSATPEGFPTDTSEAFQTMNMETRTFLIEESDGSDHFARILIVLFMSMAWTPIVLLGCALVIQSRPSLHTLSGRTAAAGIILFSTHLFLLIVHGTPFYFTHWNDDVRYLIAFVPAGTLMMAGALSPHSRPHQPAFPAGLGILTFVGLLNLLPRLLFAGRRQPFSWEAAKYKDAMFSLESIRKLTDTPEWVLNAQFAWRPFPWRLWLNQFEVFSILLTAIAVTLLLITPKQAPSSADDE